MTRSGKSGYAWYVVALPYAQFTIAVDHNGIVQSRPKVCKWIKGRQLQEVAKELGLQKARILSIEDYLDMPQSERQSWSYDRGPGNLPLGRRRRLP